MSVNPGETPAQAADAKGKMLTLYRHPGSDAGFHFLTGREENIKKLADAVGFRYTYDPAIAQYAHPAVDHCFSRRRRRCRATSSASTTARAT